MLLNLLQQFDVALADFLTVLATAGLGLFFMLAGMALPLLSVVTECVYVSTRKAFYDKCAMQTGQAAFASGMFIYMVVGFCLMFAFSVYMPEMLAPPLVWRPLIFLAVPLAMLTLLGLYIMTWSPLKKARPLHIPLGFLAALAGLFIMLSGFLLLSYSQNPMLSALLWETPLLALQTLFDEFLLMPHQWLMMAFFLFTGLASGSGLSQLWLFMRRHRADYGRDYYAFAIRYCARAASLFCLAATAVGGWIFYRLFTATPAEFRQPPDMGVMVIAYGLPVVCCVLWFFIVKSDTPMRHKAGAFFAGLFHFIALCAQLVAVISTFPAE
jgi:hypothetical protein